MTRGDDCATIRENEREEGTMRRLFWAVLAMATVGSGIHAARAEKAPDAGAYAVTYFDIIPADLPKATALLRQYVKATRKEDGNVEFTLLDQIGRKGRMATIEAWRDMAALKAHQAAVETMAGKLKSMFAAPFDTRPFVPFSVGPRAAKAKLGAAVYVVTHIDVFPDFKDKAAGLVKDFVDTSREDKGVERFDALRWGDHPNHFELLEAWTGPRARQAHVAAMPTRAFRNNLTPLEGGFYDERLYKVAK
jgi:quinol monooxygenase YgiN